MLNFMRKHAKYFYVFFFLIIISFIFFYVGPVDQNGPPPLVEVKGEKITVEEYWRAYDNMRDFYRDVYKEKFDTEMEKQLNLKEQVLSELVNTKILSLAARDLGITVSDRELTEVVVNDPAFQRDGVFRQDVYFRTLQLNRITPKYFEAKRREELLVRKMRQLIESSVIVTDDAIPDFQGNEQFVKQIKDQIIRQKKEQAVTAYIEGLKKKYRPIIRAELIA